MVLYAYKKTLPSSADEPTHPAIRWQRRRIENEHLASLSETNNRTNSKLTDPDS